MDASVRTTSVGGQKRWNSPFGRGKIGSETKEPGYITSTSLGSIFYEKGITTMIHGEESVIRKTYSRGLDRLCKARIHKNYLKHIH